jgi:hypothetical protein
MEGEKFARERKGETDLLFKGTLLELTLPLMLDPLLLETLW